MSVSLPLAEEGVYVFDARGRAVPEPVAEAPVETEDEAAPARVVVDVEALAEPVGGAVEPEPEMTLPVWFAGVIGGVNVVLLGGLFFVLRRPPLSEALQQFLDPESDPESDPGSDPEASEAPAAEAA